VWVKKNEEPGPRGSAGDFLLGKEMEGDPLGREVVEGGGIKVLLEIVDVVLAVDCHGRGPHCCCLHCLHLRCHCCCCCGRCHRCRHRRHCRHQNRTI